MPPELSDTFDLITANYEIAVSVLGLVLLALVFYRKRNSALVALKKLEGEHRDPTSHLTPIAAADWIRLRIECDPEVIHFSRLAVFGPLFGVGCGSSLLIIKGGSEVELSALAAPVLCGALVAVLHAVLSIQVDKSEALLVADYVKSYGDSPKQLSEEIRRANDSLSDLIDDTAGLRDAYGGARNKIDDSTDRLAKLAERVEILIEAFHRLPESLSKSASTVESALVKIVADLPTVQHAVERFNDDLKASKKEVKQRSQHIVESYTELSKELGRVKAVVANLDSVAKSFGELKAAHVDSVRLAVDASVTQHANALQKLVGAVENKWSAGIPMARVSEPIHGASGSSQDQALLLVELKNITARLGVLENQLHQIGSRPAFIVWTRTQLRRVRDRIAHWRNSS